MEGGRRGAPTLDPCVGKEGSQDLLFGLGAGREAAGRGQGQCVKGPESQAKLVGPEVTSIKVQAVGLCSAPTCSKCVTLGKSLDPPPGISSLVCKVGLIIGPTSQDWCEATSVQLTVVIVSCVIRESSMMNVCYSFLYSTVLQSHHSVLGPA